MAEKFQPVLSSPAGPVAAPVQRQAPNPLAFLNQVADTFFQDRANRQQRNATSATEQRRQRDVNASSFAVQSLFKYNDEIRRGVGQGLMAGASANAAAAAIRDNVPVDPTAATTPQAVLQGAVESGLVDQGRVDEVTAYSEEQSERVSNLTAAREQGRLSRLSADAAVDNIVLETMNTFPDVDPSVIFSALASAGVENAGFRDLRLSLSRQQALDEADTEQYIEALNVARENVPIELQGLYSEDDMVAIGMRHRQSEAELERRMQMLELQEREVTLNERVAAQQQKMIEKEAGQIVEQGILSMFQPIFNQLSQINLGEPGQYPQLEAEAMNMINVARRQLPLIIETQLSRQFANMPLEERAEYRDYYTEFVENVFFKPFEERNESYSGLLQMFENRLGISAIASMPLLYQLKESGIDLDYTQLVMETMDDATMEQLADELNGLTNDPISIMNNDTALGFLNRMMAVATGDSTLQDLNMETSEAFRTVRRMNQTTGRAIIEGRAAEPQVDGFRNTQMEIAAQGLNVSAGATANTLSNTITSLTGQGIGSFRVMDSLISEGDDEALVAGLGTRAAVSRNLQALTRSPDLETGTHVVEWNQNAGRFTIRAKPRELTESQRTFGMTQVPGIRNIERDVPQSLVKIQTALNNGLDFLLRSNDWDQDPAKGTRSELINLYLYGTPTKDMIKQAEEQGSANPDSAVTETMEAVQSLTRDMQNMEVEFDTPTVPGPSGVGVGPDGLPVGDTATAPALSAVDGLVSRGISEEDAIALAANFQAEVGPGLEQLNTGSGDSGTAFGLAQWRNERVENFQRVIGKHPKDATLEESLDFVVWELQNSESDAYRRMQAATTIEEKAAIVDEFYERSSGQHRRLRQGYARNLANAR